MSKRRPWIQTAHHKADTNMRLIRTGLLILLLAGLLSCAKTVSTPIESPYILKFSVTFDGTIDITRYHYFFIVGNNAFPDRNPNYLTIPMYVPGYRPGEISEHEIFINSAQSTETEAQHLATNTQYLSTWADIITFGSSTSEYQRCNGPFTTTPTTFLQLLQLCESNWIIGSTLQNSGTTSTTMSFQVQVNALSNGSNETPNLQVAVLTLDKVNPENFSTSLATLVDFASDDQGMAEADVQTKTSSLSLYSSTCSLVDASKRAACVKSVDYIRTR